MDIMDSQSRQQSVSGCERAAKENNNASKFQLRQPGIHSIQLTNIKMAHQNQIIYITIPEAGFVLKPEHWKYSIAIDYFGGEGLLKIMMPDHI